MVWRCMEALDNYEELLDDESRSYFRSGYYDGFLLIQTRLRENWTESYGYGYHCGLRDGGDESSADTIRRLTEEATEQDQKVISRR